MSLGQHLDPLGIPVGSAPQEVDQRRVVARVHRRLRTHLLEVPHHRRPLPVDQDRHQEDEREALPTPESEGEDGSEQQGPHARRIASHRALDKEGSRQRRAVGGDPVAEQALLWRQRHEDCDRDENRRLEAREVERLGSAFGEGSGDQQRHPDGDHRELEALAAALRDRVGDHAAGEEEGGNRAGERRQRREEDREDPVALLDREHGAQRDRDAKGKGEPAGEQADRGGCREPDDAQPRLVTEAPVRDPREEQRRGDRRQYARPAAGRSAR